MNAKWQANCNIYMSCPKMSAEICPVTKIGRQGLYLGRTKGVSLVE